MMTANWLTEAVGNAAAFCTTLAFLPQLIRVWRRKRAEDISLSMFLVFSAGLALWLAYGLRIGSFPVVAANTVTLVLALTILALKLRYDRRRIAAFESEAGIASGKIEA